MKQRTATAATTAAAARRFLLEELDVLLLFHEDGALGLGDTREHRLEACTDREQV